MAGAGLPQGSPSVGFSEVRLIDDPTPGTDPDFERSSRSSTGDAGVGRRTALSVATVLMLTVVLVNLGELRQTRARSDALAEVAGVLAPLGGPVTARWSADVAIWPGVIVAADLLVAVETAATGTFGVVALDPDTGSVVWRALQSEVGGGTTIQGCHLPTSPAVEGLAGSPEASDVVSIVCLIEHRAAARLDNRQPTDAVLLDARTGVIREGAVPVPPGVRPQGQEPGTLVDDGSLAGTTVQLTPEGGLVALDVRSASVRWALGPGPFRGQPAVLRTRVLVAGPDHVVCVDGRSGGVLWSVPARTDAAALLTDGQVALAPQDDPTRGAVLSAVDVDDGYVEWTSDIPEDLYLFVLDGHLYGASRDRLVALG